MRTFGLLAISATVIGMLVSCAWALDDEVKVPLDQLPKAVIDSVKAKFPAAELKGASKETENGKTSYEVSLTYRKAKHDVLLTPDGKITAIEKAIAAEDLPKSVAQAIRDKYAQATIKTAEELSDADSKITAYEVLLVLADKKELEVKLDVNGKVLNEEKKGKD